MFLHGKRKSSETDDRIKNGQSMSDLAHRFLKSSFETENMRRWTPPCSKYCPMDHRWTWQTQNEAWVL